MYIYIHTEREKHSRKLKELSLYERQTDKEIKNIKDYLQVTFRRALRVTGIKKGTCDELWMLYVSDESLNSTPETNIILYFN